MIEKNSNKEKKYDAFGILFTLYILLFSKETLIFGTNNNDAVKNAGYIISFLLCLFLLAYSVIYKVQIKKSSTFVACAFIVLTMMTMMVNSELSVKYFYEIMTFITILIVVNILSFNKFAHYYCKVMLFLSICSLITYFISIVFYPILENCPTIVNINGKKFYSCFFSNIAYKELYVQNRNYGFAREPGVFGIYLIFTLIFLIELNELDSKSKLKYAVIIIATIVTTFSTAAYITLFCVILFYLMSYRNSKFSTRIVLIAAILIFTVILLSNDYVIDLVFKKLYMKNDSVDSRINSLIVDLHIIFLNFKNFLFGCGYEFIENYFQEISFNIGFYAEANTNTVLKQMAVHGVIFGTLFVILLIKNIYINLAKKELLKTIALFVIILLILSNEDLSFNPFMLSLIFYGEIPRKQYNEYI